MRNLFRPVRAVATRVASTRAANNPIADLKDAIDSHLVLSDLLHFLGVLCLHKALTLEAADEAGNEGDYGLDFEDEQTGLETALLGYPSEVSADVKYCLSILIRLDNPTLENRVMNRLWSRIQQLSAQG